MTKSVLRAAWIFGLTLAVLPFLVRAEIYDMPLPGDDVVGAVTTVIVRADDTLLDIARRHGQGYEDIVRANPGVDTWLPGEGTEVTLPTRYVLPPGPRRGDWGSATLAQPDSTSKDVLPDRARVITRIIT